MNVPSSEVFDTSLCFRIAGHDALHVFPVREDEAERLRDILCADAQAPMGVKPFAVFDTLNGWSVAIRLASIETVQVLTDPVEHAVQHEDAEPMLVSLYFETSTAPITIYPPFPEEAAALALELDTRPHSPPARFTSIRDEDGEELFIAVDRLSLVKMNTALVAEGHRILTQADPPPHTGDDSQSRPDRL